MEQIQKPQIAMEMGFKKYWNSLPYQTISIIEQYPKYTRIIPSENSDFKQDTPADADKPHR